jgi:hypothetical protein
MVENGTVESLTIHQASFWDHQQLWDGNVVAIDGGKW